MERKGIMIKYYTTKQKFLRCIPGLIFMLIIVSIIYLSDKPWEREKRQAEAKIRAERRENFRSEKLDEFFNDCRVEYSKDDFPVTHEIDFEKFASIIKNAEHEKEHPYRSRFFGHIYFIGNKDNEFAVELTFFGYQDGYVNVTICQGEPGKADYWWHYASKELLEWAKETFPEKFEEIREYRPSWFVSNFAGFVLLGYIFLSVLISRIISGKKKQDKDYIKRFYKSLPPKT